MWNAVYETITGAGYALVWLLLLVYVFSRAIAKEDEDDTDR